MIIIGDRRIPRAARKKLNETGRFIPFFTENITYSAVSGHPDVFFFKEGNRLIVAPNTPEQYKRILKENGIGFSEGAGNVGTAYPHTARYNAVATDTFLIHNLKITDQRILEQCAGKRKINVKQGYTRCNLLPLPGNSFVTSDEGIFKTLNNEGLDVLYVAPQGIVLPGFGNGFIGGCAGVSGRNVYFTGSLRYFSAGKKLEHFLLSKGFEIVELYDGPLYDGGGLFFI